MNSYQYKNPYLQRRASRLVRVRRGALQRKRVVIIKDSLRAGYLQQNVTETAFAWYKYE